MGPPEGGDKVPQLEPHRRLDSGRVTAVHRLALEVQHPVLVGQPEELRASGMASSGQGARIRNEDVDMRTVHF